MIVGDAAEAPVEGEFDAVLVDPPCTGLGTLASRPDARWRRSPDDVGEMATTAERILRRGLAALRPGGRLVYSTCTISRRENEGVVAAVEGAEPEDLGAAPGGFASVLLERGARVLAVDPARLDPDLEDAPGLTFLRRYAADLDPRDVPPLDILTCDIVTAPATAAALIRPFAARLAPGAPAIVTLKLRSKPAPSEQLDGAAALFAPALELVRVRHLAANRCEVTAFLRRAR